MTTTSSARADLTSEVHIDVDWQQQELFCRRELAKIFGRTLDPLESIREIFHLLSECLGLNRGRLALMDEGSGLLQIRCAYGLTNAEIARGRFRPDEGLTGKVFRSGAIAVVQDIDAEATYLWRTTPREDLPRGTIAVLAFPVRVDGRVRGVFSINRFRAVSRSLADDVGILREVSIQIGQVLRIEQLVAERVQRQTAQLQAENHQLKQVLDGRALRFGMIGDSLQMRAGLRQIEQVAPTDATVLLLGESGTGKELFARAVHTASQRSAGPFIKLNCGAIPESLFESELFGHEKGAFTGAASAKAGLFEYANGGTLFLDEIGELPLGMQVKLLRALQERSVMRIGARVERTIDVRIVAATNQDLQRLVEDGRFRTDLFYRLHVIPIRLPPLRERPEDTGPLARHFTAQVSARLNRDAVLSEGALALLLQYHWPGNVRQLENVVERLVLLGDGQEITAAQTATLLDLEPRARNADSAVRSDKRSISTHDATSANALKPSMSNFRRPCDDDKQAIAAALAHCGGVKSRAAQHLGLTLSQLNYRLRIFAARTEVVDVNA